MDNIEETVLELVRKQVGIDSQSIFLSSKLEDLNLDSVAIVELVFLLEEKFDISIPFEGLDESELKKNFYTVSSIIDYLKDLLRKDA